MGVYGSMGDGIDRVKKWEGSSLHVSSLFVLRSKDTKGSVSQHFLDK